MKGLIYRLKNRLLQSLSLRLQNVNITELHNRASIGKKVVIKGAYLIGNIRIEEGCKLLGGVSIRAKNEINIAKYTSINGPNTDIVNYLNKVSIGAFTSIARNVSIQEFNHRTDTLTSYHIHHNLFKTSRIEDIYSNGPIVIGNDVWIGTQCVILSGALIGDGVVIAANSVVRGEVPPYSIVAGSPAKVIGMRFDEETIEYLLEFRWWEKPIEEILHNKHLFSDKVDVSLLKKWRSL